MENIPGICFICASIFCMLGVFFPNLRNYRERYSGRRPGSLKFAGFALIFWSGGIATLHFEVVREHIRLLFLPPFILGLIMCILSIIIDKYSFPRS
jgi:hypothetical protein